MLSNFQLLAIYKSFILGIIAVFQITTKSTVDEVVLIVLAAYLLLIGALNFFIIFFKIVPSPLSRPRPLLAEGVLFFPFQIISFSWSNPSIYPIYPETWSEPLHRIDGSATRDMARNFHQRVDLNRVPPDRNRNCLTTEPLLPKLTTTSQYRWHNSKKNYVSMFLTRWTFIVVSFIILVITKIYGGKEGWGRIPRK